MGCRWLLVALSCSLHRKSYCSIKRHYQRSVRCGCIKYHETMQCQFLQHWLGAVIIVGQDFKKRKIDLRLKLREIKCKEEPHLHLYSTVYIFFCLSFIGCEGLEPIPAFGAWSPYYAREMEGQKQTIHRWVYLQLNWAQVAPLGQILRKLQKLQYLKHTKNNRLYESIMKVHFSFLALTCVN